MSETESRRVFQKRFCSLLQENHMSQKEIADICDVSTSTVSTWYKGLNIPRMDKIEQLANYFNLPKSFFIDESAPDARGKTTPTPEGERWDDPEIYRIQRARKNMTPAEKKRMMNILKASFEDYFSDDYVDDDIDE